MRRHMENEIKVFLDSSVILSAVFSQKGASYFILHEAMEVDLQMSEYVFREIHKTIKNKFEASQETLLNQVFVMLSEAQVSFVPNPGRSDFLNLEEYISKKDLPILSTALLHSDYLLTLDNEFFSDEIIEMAFHKKLTILKPGAFLRKFRGAIL